MGTKNIKSTKISSQLENKKDNNNIFEDLKIVEKQNMKVSENNVSNSSFEFLEIIGRGGFGKVWKVLHKKSKKIYAMKKMSKCTIIDKRSETSILEERNLLVKMHHPFIINIYYCFQDIDYLYITMDLLTGGDLRHQIFRNKIFNEAQSKFFLSCIILSLEYIHTNNILHRDLKPENLVFDSKGYLKLTDFGIAKVYRKENNRDTSGTPGYMAPEVMNGQNHTIAVDYFALGVIGYELMFGRRPYLGKNRKEIKEKIMSTEIYIKDNMIPQGWSKECADFINRLLKRKPANRLGLRGPTEVKEHQWFKDYDWKNLYLGNLQTSFIPNNGNNFDYNYCNEADKRGQKTKERYRTIKLDSKYKMAFANFKYFDRFSYQNRKNRDEKSSIFKNPHLIYVNNDNNISKIHRSNSKEKKDASDNKLKKINDDEFTVIKKLPTSRSTISLLKGYRRPLSALHK